MTISGLQQLQPKINFEEENLIDFQRLESKKSSVDSYPDPINYEEYPGPEESDEFMEFLGNILR